MGKGREISTVTPVEELGINLVLQIGISSVLDRQPRREVGHIVDVWLIGDLLLDDGLRAEEGGQKEELGDVRPQRFAREAASEEQVRRNMDMFERAFAMFAPFARREGGEGGESEKAPGKSGDIDDLKRQLDEMKRKVDRLTGGGE